MSLSLEILGTLAVLVRFPETVVCLESEGSRRTLFTLCCVEWFVAMRNVFEAILECGHDEDFAPNNCEDFTPTDAPAGSKAKLEVLAERIRRGFPLWHPEDRFDYSGLTGAVRPRE
jgi:hypothetical protein